jgi:drug/metabolite transporter (DMT)-like permease
LDPTTYLLGVLLAILSGIANNFGTVLQKKVVNEHRNDEEFLKNIAKDKTWLIGLILQLAIGSIFFMVAQLLIGPALVPGLMAAGLIVLTLGSIKILGETLKRDEYIGIIIMIIGILLLGLSELSIPTETLNLENYILTMTIFTVILVLGAITCKMLAKKIGRVKALLLAIFSGFMFSLSNFWISPLMIVFEQMNFTPVYIIIFIIASVILVLTNIFGITELQKAFTAGQASNLIPVQQVPIQITPIFIYFFVFLLTAPPIAFVYISIGVALIILSSFLLGKRQAQMEEIQK